MDDSLKKLSLLIEECVDDKIYTLKNKVNFIKAYIKEGDRGAKIEEAYNLKVNYRNYRYGKLFDFRILENINEGIQIQDNVYGINPDYLDLSINEISEKINNIIYSVDSFNYYINKGYNYINFVNENNIYEINNDYAFNENDFQNFKYLLLKKVEEKLYFYYDIEHLKYITETIDSFKGNEDSLVEFLIYIYNDNYYYNNNIDKNSSCLNIIFSEAIDYQQAKEYVNTYEEKIYYANFNSNRVLTNFKNIKIINCSNYKKNIDVKCDANLMSDAMTNIKSIFGKYIKDGEEYLVSANAYFLALQDIKIYRGKKRCWICGEKLGLFSSGITCKEHKDQENIL